MYFVVFIFSFSSVYAETKIENNIKKNILLENQKEQFEKMRQNSDENIFYYDTKKLKLENEKAGNCIKIKTIEENTITLLTNDEKQSIFQKYENTCRTLPELNNLRKELTQLYINKGYVTSQVYFKAQNMTNGVLELYAIEGKISKIFPKQRYIKNAFLGQEGNFLNLRDIEDSIETINQLPSNHATLELVPGEAVGTTVLKVDNNVTNRLHGVIGIDNYGEDVTGKLQGSIEFDIDNILSLNDQFSVFLNTTDKHVQTENSKGSGCQYLMPIGGKITTILRYKKSTYKQLIHALINDYEAKGEISTYSFDLKYKLFHNQKNSVNIGTIISHERDKNYIDDTLIEVSSYNISKVSMNLGYLYRTDDFYSYISFTYVKGNTWFDDFNPTDLDEHFSLFTVDISMMKQFSFLTYTLNTHYQHSNYQLFSTDQISIGGPYSVRGYKEEGLNGNTGYYARNEFSKNLRSKLFNFFDQTYFLAFDSGWIEKEQNVNYGKLLSYSIGAKYQKDSFSTEVYYAIPVYDQDVSKTSKFLGISMSYIY
jgi:hemolysin activation/secretion protein